MKTNVSNNYDITAFLLTSKAQDSIPVGKKPKELQIVLYGRSKEYGVVEVIFDNVPAIIVVAQEEVLPELKGIIHTELLELKSFDKGEPLRGLYFSSLESWYEAQDVLKQEDISFYETDMLPDERFLTENFINGQCKISGVAIEKGQCLSFINPSISSADSQVNLKVLSLDIETGVKSKQLYSIAGHLCGEGGEHRRVFMLNDEERQENDWLTFHSTEASLLKAFYEWFIDVNPDIIIGWYVIGFDFIYLENKYRQFHLPFNIGRDGSRPVFTVLSSGLTTATISGRVVIDGIPYFRKYKKLENYKLETVAQEYLGVGKVITPDEDKVGEIENLFRNDKLKLAEYNIVDCTLVSEIFQKNFVLDYYIYCTKMTGVLISKNNLENLIFKKLYTPYLHRLGYSSTVKDSGVKKGQFALYEIIAKQGMYKNVIEVNLGNFLLTICKGLEIDPLKNAYVDEEAILPRLFSHLDSYAKKLENQPLVLASEHCQHVLVRQLYSFNSLFFDVKMVKQLADFVKGVLDKFNDYLLASNRIIIYVNYEKVYISNVEEKDVIEVINELTSIANNYIGLINSFDFQIKSRYIKFLSYTEDKKLKFFASTNAENEKFGMAITKRSSYDLLNYLQEEILKQILNEDDCQAWLREFIMELKNGNHDDKLFYHRKINKKPHEYKGNLPPEMVAAMQLEELPLNISYIMTIDGVVVKSLYNSQEVDYNHYINLRIKPLINSLFGIIDSNYHDSIEVLQLDLFV